MSCEEWRITAEELDLPALNELIGAAEEDMDGGDNAAENYRKALSEAKKRGYSDEQFANILRCATSGLASGGWDNASMAIEFIHEKFMEERRN